MDIAKQHCDILMKPHWIAQIDAKLWPEVIFDQKAETTKEIAKSFNISISTAKEKIREMIKKQTVEKVRKKNHSGHVVWAYRPKKN